MEKFFNSPCFQPIVYSNLPRFLEQCTKHFDDSRERDVVLFSSVCVISGIFKTVEGKYHDKQSSTNLFGFVVAPPASLKGSMLYGRMLADAIQDRHQKQNDAAKNQYFANLNLWKKNKKNNPSQPPPVKPALPDLLFSGNITASAFYRKLDQSKGVGILVESEADTLANSIASEMGNFSDLLRKCFHSEPVTLSRSTDDVNISILRPRLSVLLSGTPNQVPKLIQSAEDGLFSRFLFYVYSKKLQWIDPTPCTDCEDLSAFFNQLSIQIRDMMDELDKQRYEFKLSAKQFGVLSENFRGKVESIRLFEGHAAASVVFRLGLIAFRIAMIFSTLRLFESPRNGVAEIKCTDEDMQTTLLITDTLFEHSLLMYSLLPQNSSNNMKLRDFYNALPDGMFKRKQANELGESIGIAERTVGNYLAQLEKDGLLTKPDYGHYLKCSR